MSKFERALSDNDVRALIDWISEKPRHVDKMLMRVEQSVLAKLAEQEPVAEIDYFGDTCCHVFGDRLQLKRGTKLYANPKPNHTADIRKAATPLTQRKIQTLLDKGEYRVIENATVLVNENGHAAIVNHGGAFYWVENKALAREYDGTFIDEGTKEHHRTTKSHIPNAGKMVAPHGYRLVSLADIDTAIQRASVFDDGGDGADPESARSCIEILKSMISSKAVDSLEPRKEVVHDRHTGRELLYFPPVGESLYSMAQARKESFSLALSVDTKKVQALLQSYLDSLEGWQLVPIEPTSEMLDEIMVTSNYKKDQFKSFYKRMLAAAPKHTGEK